MGGGDLDAVTSEGTTVGQRFCDNLEADGILNFGPNKVRVREASSYSVRVNLVITRLPSHHHKGH